MFKRLKVLINKPDFRENPLKALWKRFYWRIRWMLKSNLKGIEMANGLKLFVPQGGAGAAIFYHKVSEPDTMDFILKTLKPGSIFIDIGAHLGEYVLTTSQIVGGDGKVHAFEPLPDMFEILQYNVRINRLNNIVINQRAVGDYDGQAEFELYAERSICSFKKNQRRNKPIDTIWVDSIQLDTYWKNCLGNKKIDIIKIDVEGAEYKVLSGASSILSSEGARSPIIIFEYSPSNYAEFGYIPSEVIMLLRKAGYKVLQYSIKDGLTLIEDNDLPLNDTNLIAAKDRILGNDLQWKYVF